MKMLGYINYFFALFLYGLPFIAYSQPDTSYYRSPLDRPLSLSGNFGELRPNHFHSGLDFRVGGVAGAKLHAVADGYIARITVRPTGLGNALYIQHPNGTLSIYGHMEDFSPKIKAYVENIQYARQRFSIDVQPNRSELVIRKGEIIGSAGNTGNSFGPHLHFEICDSKNLKSVNPITQGYYRINDNLRPNIYAVCFYEYREKEEIPVIEKFAAYAAGNSKQPILVPDTFYLAINCSDRINGSSAKLGINRLVVELDKDTVFAFRIDAFSLNETLYINSFIEYGEAQQRNGPVMIKTYLEPGNKLSLYEKTVNRGLITLTDHEKHTLSIKVTDDYGNTTIQEIQIQKKENSKSFSSVDMPNNKTDIAFWDRENHFTRDGLSVHIPKNALYRSTFIAIDTMKQVRGSYSSTWSIHQNTTPLHRSMNVFLQASIPDSLQNKAIIASLMPNGNISAVGGQWKGNGVSVNTRSFGNFFVTVDTTAPRITPRFREGADLRQTAKMTIRITDKLSGIASYNAYIDGKWALFVYDAKNNSLTYTFDPKRLERNTRHQLQLVVTDNKQNTASLNTSFTW